MSKTLRRDKIPWWDNEGMIEGSPFGSIPLVKDAQGLKNLRDSTCKPGCRLCGRGPKIKRERMKKIRREASVDITERM